MKRLPLIILMALASLLASLSLPAIAAPRVATEAFVTNRIANAKIAWSAVTNAPTATTSRAGVVQLTASTNSTSATLAPTAFALRSVAQTANTAATTAAAKQDALPYPTNAIPWAAVVKDAISWIGSSGDAGKVLKFLAFGTNPTVGGIQIAWSISNDNNLTSYFYDGVGVKRNGVNEDYLFDTSSTNGIVRRKELGAYKPRQTAKSSPTASGTSAQFIDTISQDANGVITATKKSVRGASTSQTGVVQLSTATNSTSTTLAATPSAVKAVRDEVGAVAVDVASHGERLQAAEQDIDALETGLAAKADAEKAVLGGLTLPADALPVQYWTAANPSAATTSSVVTASYPGTGNYYRLYDATDPENPVFIAKFYTDNAAFYDAALPSVWQITFNGNAGGVNIWPRLVNAETNTYPVVYADALASLSNNLSQAIVDAAPADYANVSNKAYSAVQVESDPTIGLTNGTIYVRGDTLTPLTQHQSLSGYVPTSRTVNSKALSANITLSASDVGAAPSSLSSTVNTISGKVSALETWSIGNDTQLRVENAGATNATLAVLYTNKVMYASATAESNTLAKAAAYTDASALELAQAFDSALASDAWGERTSSGAPSPADTLIVGKPKVAVTGGGNYSYIESSTGGYWVMAVSLGSQWTLESLADAQNPTNPATIALYDMEGNAVQTVTSTSSREAYAVEGEQYISVANVGGNDVITIAYPVVADSAPTLLFSPVVAGLDDFHTYDYWPSNIASVVASGASGMWTNTVTMVGHPGQGFFRAKYTKAGQTYTSFNKPLGLSQIVIGGTTYDLAVETINNKKLIVLTEAE